MQPEISVVVTIYNASPAIDELHQRLVKSLSQINPSFSIIYVEDKGKDDSWDKLRKIAVTDPSRITCIRFARNFGQHAAITAGLHHAKGKYVVLMDGDLQDEPESIHLLYNKIQGTSKPVVFARRVNRQDSGSKKITSRIFYSIFSMMSGIHSDPTIGTFRIMHSKVVQAFCQFHEVNKYIGGLFYWMNFDHEFVDILHAGRKFGSSNYTWKKMLNLATRGIIGFSNKPLILSIYIGVSCAGFSFLMALYFALRKIMLNVSVTGYSSLIVSIFFIGGMILMALGVIGRYIAEIHDQIRRRPEYIIDEITGEQ